MSTQRAFTGYYTPKKKSKYVGDKRNIYYRSSWERSFCKWCDDNPKVLRWKIEPLEIPYYDDGKKKVRRYTPDFWVKMEDGKTYLVEIKPDYETRPPRMKKDSAKYLIQEATYITNTSKWKAAKKLCEKREWTFLVLTEKTLVKMGVKLLQRHPALKRKGTPKKKVKYSNKTYVNGSSRRKQPKTGRQKVNKVCQ